MATRRAQNVTKTRLISHLVSIFTRGPPNVIPLERLKKIKMDSYLISIGLISSKFGEKHTFGQTFWKTSHQLLVMLIQWLMLIKWIVCSTLASKYNWSPAITGDFTEYLSGEAFDHHFVLIMWASISALSCSLFWSARRNQKLNVLWLEPFELCKGSVKPEEMKMEMQETSYFWQRCLITLWATKFFVRVLFVVFGGAYIYVMIYLCPKCDWNYISIFWFILTIIWIYYTLSIQISVMSVFHMLCYYFIVKFRRLNEIVKEIELNPKLDLKSIHERISHYMIHHNVYAKELSVYNKFWQFYILKDFLIYITVVCFFVELILFTRMRFWIQIISLTTIFVNFFALIFVAFSASAVSDEMHESYTVLNAVCQNNMPLVLKTQLQIYIQRVGGPIMGFSCWDLFAVNYDGFLQALLMISSFFLLFMDVNQTEKKKRMQISTRVTTESSDAIAIE